MFAKDANKLARPFIAVECELRRVVRRATDAKTPTPTVECRGGSALLGLRRNGLTSTQT